MEELQSAWDWYRNVITKKRGEKDTEETSERVVISKGRAYIEVAGKRGCK